MLANNPQPFSIDDLFQHKAIEPLKLRELWTLEKTFLQGAPQYRQLLRERGISEGEYVSEAFYVAQRRCGRASQHSLHRHALVRQ